MQEGAGKDVLLREVSSYQREGSTVITDLHITTVCFEEDEHC